jgi:hypothetical protein
VSLAWHICQSQHAAAARLRPTVAVVSAPGLVIADVYVLEAPQPPPPSQYDIVLNMLLAATMVLAGTAVLLICCYLPCRVVLDRRRLARWEHAWALTGRHGRVANDVLKTTSGCADRYVSGGLLHHDVPDPPAQQSRLPTCELGHRPAVGRPRTKNSPWACGSRRPPKRRHRGQVRTRPLTFRA